MVKGIFNQSLDSHDESGESELPDKGCSYPTMEALGYVEKSP